MNTLPAPPASPPHALESPGEPEVRILIVDDQPTNIQLAGTVLAKLGCDLVLASDGALALKRIEMRKPDLILLDVLMPGMDGIEVCRRIRANPAWNDIPIIFLSAADDKDLIVQALEAGGVDYVTKPFNAAEMTSRVRTHLALKAARDRLKRLAEDKDELIGILTHDMKSGLTGIHMSAQILAERTAQYSDPRTTRLCEGIRHTGGQLLSFLKEFLANAAADHGFHPQLQTLNFGEAVARVVQAYQECAHRKKLNLRVVPAVGDTAVCGDGDALRQVLDNLLSNAVKFSPPNTEITVTLHTDARAVEAVVRDQGPGFTAEDKARMFRRYGRLSARPTGGEPSTGLGLSIVKSLVEGMGGALSCQSEPGEGAAFAVRLPRAPLVSAVRTINRTAKRT